jgi:hypothetical protein
VGIPGQNAFLKKAITKLEADIPDEVFQVKPTGDPSPPKPQPVRISVGHEPSTQYVADHDRTAGPGITPRRHRGLVNHLIIGDQVKPFSTADMFD